MGLCFAVTLDVIITVATCYYLRKNKSGIIAYVSLLSTLVLVFIPMGSKHSTNRILDTLVLYTVENGAITWYELTSNPFPSAHSSIQLGSNRYLSMRGSLTVISSSKLPIFLFLVDRNASQLNILSTSLHDQQR